MTGLSKKLRKLAQRRVAFVQIGRWVPALSTHLYYTIEHSPQKSELRLDMWKSATNHICNIHSHESDVFPQCLHGELTTKTEDGVTYERDWIDPG